MSLTNASNQDSTDDIAGLTIHSFWNLAHVDLGIKTDHVLTFFLPVPETRSKDPQVISAYYRDILAHVAAVPGVQHTAAMTGQCTVTRAIQRFADKTSRSIAQAIRMATAG